MDHLVVTDGNIIYVIVITIQNLISSMLWKEQINQAIILMYFINILTIQQTAPVQNTTQNYCHFHSDPWYSFGDLLTDPDLLCDLPNSSSLSAVSRSTTDCLIFPSTAAPSAGFGLANTSLD